MSLFLVDIDYFKEFNDFYGYAAGDECLIKIAKALDEVNKNSHGFAARYDGVRFAAIQKGNKSEQTLMLAKQMHKVVEDLKIRHESSPICAHVSISIGVVHIESDYRGSEHEILKLADDALVKSHIQHERTIVLNR